MSESIVNGIFFSILGMLKKEMKNVGYRNSKSNFWRTNENIISIVNIQRSVSSSPTCIYFTINIGIILLELCKEKASSAKVPSIWNSHLRLRIGRLMEENNDKWWEISGDTDASTMSSEILDSITRYALPYLGKFRSTNDVLALWEKGESPGITKKNRQDFINILKSSGQVNNFHP